MDQKSIYLMSASFQVCFERINTFALITECDHMTVGHSGNPGDEIT